MFRLRNRNSLIKNIEKKTPSQQNAKRAKYPVSNARIMIRTPHKTNCGAVQGVEEVHIEVKKVILTLQIKTRTRLITKIIDLFREYVNSFHMHMKFNLHYHSLFG